MKNLCKLLATILSMTLVIGLVCVPVFAVTGTGTVEDPLICETLADIPTTYTIEPFSELWLRAPVGGEILSVSDPDGYAEFMHPMTYFHMGTSMDYTNLPDGEIDDICIVNNSPIFPAEIEIAIGKLGGDDAEGGNASIGTEENPLVVEPSAMIDNTYLMNDALEAGDADGIWYSLTAWQAGVMFVDVNCYDSVDYGCDVFVGSKQGVASEGNPIITFRIKEGDTVLIHKYVNADKNGNIPAAASFYVSADVVTANEEEPVSIKTKEVKVPVAGGDTICLMDQSRQAVYCGHGLIVSGYADAIKLATVTINGKAYKDVDGDGQIELNVPGDAMARPVITIKNGHTWDISFTFTAVESAEEGEPVALPGDITGDGDINNDDVVYLLWHTLFSDEYPLEVSGDITGDGDINNDDVVYLLWHTLFPGEYPL